MDMHERLQKLTKTIDNIKMEKAKQEALMETAKERRDELLADLKEMGYTNVKEVPQIIEDLEQEIESLLSKIESMIA